MGKSDAKRTSKRKRGGDGETEERSTAANNAQRRHRKPKSEAGEQAGSVDADKKPWNFKLSLERQRSARMAREKRDSKTKCSDSKLPPEIKSPETRKVTPELGFCRNKTDRRQYGIGFGETRQGRKRVITAEYEKFYLVAVYVPNAGKKLVRHGTGTDFRAYLKELENEKPVVLCGDVNVKRSISPTPKRTRKTPASLRRNEMALRALLDSGFVDSFRHLYPDKKGAYTFWTCMMNARARNVGWRLDYFVLSNALENNISDSLIHSEVMGRMTQGSRDLHRHASLFVAMGKSDAKRTSKRKRGGDGETEERSTAANNAQEASQKPKSEAGEQAGSVDADKKPWNFKLSLERQRSARMARKRGTRVPQEQPDVFAIQETKCSDSKLPPEIKSVDGYHSYFLAGDQEGYSGVGLLSKIKPIDVKYEIDLANPKTNKKNAGFTQEERDGFTALLDSGFVDSFRHLYPDKKGAYTFWTCMMNARARNVGWRLDYFVLSNALENNISDSLIHSEVMGSDHCPVVLLLNI
ncbi:hypothetical protein HPB50_018391 [Hyalomma asiaticum]|uniref:Uncharacterized protein n=1 Tax=Hyalomma asiaticum TaxID=266040 RepID=A0ACB7SAR5_HYAAI|nr:hypothetical protein HPB50_018391 [Hyalomma asiaticum]